MPGKQKNTTPSDKKIGKLICSARRITNTTQTSLAEKLGVCRQQLSKYEKGKDRITVSRLKEIAKILDLDISYFFADNLASK